MNDKAVEAYLLPLATCVDMQLRLLASQPGFKEFLGSPYCHGYLLGFFEAALQKRGLSDDHDQLVQRLVTAHMILFSCERISAEHYLRHSLDQQDGPAFGRARHAAGSELWDLLDQKVKSPVGLLSLFRESTSPELPSASAPSDPPEGARPAHRPVSDHHLRPVFDEPDLHLLEQFCALLRQTSEREAVFEIRSIGNNAASCGISLSIRGKLVLLASIVGVQTEQGAEYSVRDFQKQPIPGLPALYDSVSQALIAHKAYFLAVVRGLQEEAKPWWKRLLT